MSEPSDGDRPQAEPLPAEDEKLVTLARSARARSAAPEGAAVRDDMGRTYVASTVRLQSLQLSAVQAVVAAAVSSGSEDLEAAAVVGDRPAIDQADRVLLGELSVRRLLVAAPGRGAHVEVLEP